MTYTPAVNDRDDNALAWPNPSGDAGISYPMEDYALLPGFVPIGISVVTADGYPGNWNQGQPDRDSIALFSGDIAPNPEIGGLPGMAGGTRLPWSYGGVESTVVENFELTGEQIHLRRPAQTGDGPVGFMDYSGYLAQALAQDTYDISYDDKSQSDILTAV